VITEMENGNNEMTIKVTKAGEERENSPFVKMENLVGELRESE